MPEIECRLTCRMFYSGVYHSASNLIREHNGDTYMRVSTFALVGIPLLTGIATLQQVSKTRPSLSVSSDVVQRDSRIPCTSLWSMITASAVLVVHLVDFLFARRVSRTSSQRWCSLDMPSRATRRNVGRMRSFNSSLSLPPAPPCGDCPRPGPYETMRALDPIRSRLFRPRKRRAK